MAKTYKILSLVIILEITAIYAANNNHYCNIRSCNNPRAHTLCRYNPRRLGNECSKYQVLSTGVNYTERQEILQKHNELRQFVASGRELKGRPGPQPATTFMPNLTWDNTLELIAQTWVNQCTYGDHDQCRDVEYFPVGQNTFWQRQNSLADLGLRKLVQGWYDEVSRFNNRFVNSFQDTDGEWSVRNPTKSWAHYTQVVWAETTKIGCGQIIYRNGPQYEHLFICNYGPSGNDLYEKVYQARQLIRG